jgi:O-acetyl-ADP-ribose deacetylase (regulator of RNase III)
MKIITGDLLNLAESGEFDLIVHGCNCFNNMGAGIAAQIARRYPIVQRCDNSTIPGDESKLGTIEIVSTGLGFSVVNAYTQYYPGPDIRYKALRECFHKLRERAQGLRVGIPKIGCGLAGGDWEVVSGIIEDEMKDFDITLVEFKS